MSDKEYFEKISLGLKISVERTLKRKAALGENVVYAHPDGTPYSIPATEALDRYMSARK